MDILFCGEAVKGHYAMILLPQTSYLHDNDKIEEKCLILFGNGTGFADEVYDFVMS